MSEKNISSRELWQLMICSFAGGMLLVLSLWLFSDTGGIWKWFSIFIMIVGLVAVGYGRNCVSDKKHKKDSTKRWVKSNKKGK